MSSGSMGMDLVTEAPMRLSCSHYPCISCWLGLPVKGFITNFMLFVTVKRGNCCRFSSWKWFRSFTSSYDFGVIFLFFSRRRCWIPGKWNKPFIIRVDTASIYLRSENSVMWVAVPWASPFQGCHTCLCCPRISVYGLPYKRCKPEYLENTEVKLWKA